MLEDFSGNKLAEIIESNPAAVVLELEKSLPNFVGYKKLSVRGKSGDKNTPWSKGYKWQLEFPADGAAATPTTPAHTQTGIGAVDYVNMMEKMFTKQLEGQKELLTLQKDLFQKEQQIKQQDPDKWVNAFIAAAPYLGFTPPQGIAGPPKGPEAPKDLYFQDVDTANMTSDEIGKLIGERLESIAKKINGSQMLQVVTQLDNNPNLQTQTGKISALLKAIISKPELLEMAMKFI